METLGIKYQTYIEDTLVVLRLIKIEEKDGNKIYTLLDNNNKRVKIDSEEKLKSFVILSPDAILNIMSTECDNTDKDVFMCVQKKRKIETDCKKIMPDLIVRQDIYSNTKNWFNSGNTIYVGDCLVNNTYQFEQEYENFFYFHSIVESDSIALYIDDKIEDIKTILTQKRFNKFNDTLKDIKKKKENHWTVGYCESLVELMETNSFIPNFRSLFNIHQLDFPIGLYNNINDDGVVLLNNKQINRLQQFLQKYISDIFVLKYDKDINVSKIIRNTHIMVSDSNYDIFIITYKVDGEMVTEDNIDIVNAMNKRIGKR